MHPDRKTKNVVLTKNSSDKILSESVRTQPVVHFLIFARRVIPGEISCHTAVNQFIPFTLFVVINVIAYCNVKYISCAL